ncbi:uncharacterized protein LOC110463670 isoform X2 [Mizuhopecten yessoensis]|uniref:Uncharacterized protein n=1 Tax=Mizuhopecten yessoensis TaxID=6573 RepID=A0A210PVL9_MIZYE|nr:uncharacterized protein LOC110463670 isoform X2 [Mizuhopecten yessoensis]OWF40505.1 hypothetical protein KP79_PYT19047 [Mizuhopecten yessoensis]
MRISHLLMLLLAEFVRGREEGAGPVPCFPKCALSEEGRRLCETLLTLKPCVDRIKQQGSDGTTMCSCQWTNVLSHPGYSHLLDNSECLQYSLSTCETNTRQSIDTTGSEYPISEFLPEIQKENSRIEKITDESKKRDAKIKLLNAVHDIIELIRQLEASKKGKLSDSTGQPGSTNLSLNLDKILSGEWRTLPVTTKKPSTKMHPLKDDKRFHIAAFSVLVLLLLVVTVLCLVAKIKTDRTGVNLDIKGDLDLDYRSAPRTSFGTLLEKLRLRSKEKATENAKRGQSTGSAKYQSMMTKPPMTVPSKGSVGRRNSNTSLNSVAGQRSDSCTMISGLTHGNTSGSDVEIDNEFRMFRTNFKKDFKSLLNVDKD